MLRRDGSQLCGITTKSKVSLTSFLSITAGTQWCHADLINELFIQIQLFALLQYPYLGLIQDDFHLS